MGEASLVTVIVPLGSRPIEIGGGSFHLCFDLANLVLPQWSNGESNSFDECALLEDRFGAGADGIAAGFVARFDGYPVHKCATTIPLSPPKNFVKGFRTNKRWKNFWWMSSE